MVPGYRLRQKDTRRRFLTLVIAEWRETYRVRSDVKKRVINLGKEAFRGWQLGQSSDSSSLPSSCVSNEGSQLSIGYSACGKLCRATGLDYA
jgi:hypothetical protein